MKRKYNYFLLLALHFFILSVQGQNVSLFEQFNGRYDFTFVGNTLNPQENTFQIFPNILTQSQANISLNSDDTLLKAYLYWAGSGDGDFEVFLNDTEFVAERSFSLIRDINGVLFTYFSAFCDITDYVNQNGNGEYIFSGLDNTSFLPLHFQRRTNFAGWAIILVYSNPDLPLNQINLYDGLQAVPESLEITLSSLNVIDNQDAKIGFLAWEGDVGIAVNETLRINGTILSNPPLNPANNAFNGTNSVTGSSSTYNMDLDIYTIQDNIQPGDTSAEITLTSDQDFVMINAVVTKLNSQIPDATVVIDQFEQKCDSRLIEVSYTVFNVNATNPLPAQTPLAFYANGQLIATNQTQQIIPIGGSESGTVVLNIPNTIDSDFELIVSVDDIGNGTGIVMEINENNNTDSANLSLWVSPILETNRYFETCNLGFGKGNFDLNEIALALLTTTTDILTFHYTEAEALSGENPISPTGLFEVQNQITLYVKVQNTHCETLISIILRVKNCPPTVYNWISANNDGYNDSFYISGLRDVFLNFSISIYNRWGIKVWTGNQQTENWKGEVIHFRSWSGATAPDGTYFYVLDLNDPDYPNPFTGFLYLTR